MKNENIISDLMIDEMVINPIKNIINKIEDLSFRDCDIEYLDTKLNSYINLSLEIINVNIKAPKEKTYILNDYSRGRYVKYFNMILRMFEKILNQAD